LNGIKRETSRTFRDKQGDYLNEIYELETEEKCQTFYRGINEFKKGYKPRTNLVKVRMLIYL